MSERNMRIVFSSGIRELTERNASFDEGVLRVAYVGKNRNNSFISKETFERCMPSIYNCPIVCRYDRETDTIGSHDMELVASGDGSMHIVNVTQPVGIVPESSKYWWEEIDDASGVHEYLCVNVLLWKRQEAYKKIKEDGVTDESMEIEVKEGRMVDGVYVIDRFEFTAFCLLGTAEPCYESASLEMFSCNDFKQQLADMMQEFKETFAITAQPSQEVGIVPQNDSEGGKEVLDEKNKLMAEFGLTAGMLDFSINDFSVEELRAKFEELKNKGGAEPTGGTQNNFELEGQFRQELWAALEAETIETEWGSMPRYWYVDYDRDASEVYAQDSSDDWNLYGFSYSMNGDHVVVDFGCRKRKKYSIVDFDEGEQVTTAGRLFELASKKFSEASAEWTEKYQRATEAASANDTELAALRKFKADTEGAVEQARRNEVLAQFEDLNGVEAFETLREHSMEYDMDTLEEKCFAIRGRNGVAAKFSRESNPVKLMIDRTKDESEPYGGVFAEYGIKAPSQCN